MTTQYWISGTSGDWSTAADWVSGVVPGVSADRIVFFDDTRENIEGAQARGLQAVHVKSGADLADALAVLIEQGHARGA